MKKAISIILSSVLIFGIISFIPAFEQKAKADTEGIFTYTVSNGEATIIGCNRYEVYNNINIPDTLGGYPVTSIGNSVFYSCYNLISITIPNGVINIGNYAFYDCYNLTSITIPYSLTSIGIYAFGYCNGLTSLTLPKNVSSIGIFAFNYCYKLSEINVNSENNYFSSLDGVLFNKDKTELIKYPPARIGDYIIPNSVKRIYYNAFESCENITQIKIPDGISSIEYRTFCDCRNLTSVTLPEGLTGIGMNAFDNCINLTAINIPDSVTSIANGAFYNTNWFSKLTDEFAIVGKQVLIKYNGTDSDVTIPDNVLSIGGGAFWSKSLTSVIIPNSVTTICEDAFVSQSNLISIIIPDSVTSIENDAFEYCNNLKSVTLSKNLSTINDRTFMYCSSLSTAVIPDSVIGIGSEAFLDCTSLFSITLSKNLKSIDDEAFEGCSSLTEITIPNGVTEIDDEAFEGCSNLTTVYIPDSVTSIGDDAFRNCYGLVILGKENSYAHDYAKQKGFLFIDNSKYNYGLNASGYYFDDLKEVHILVNICNINRQKSGIRLNEAIYDENDVLVKTISKDIILDGSLMNSYLECVDFSNFGDGYKLKVFLWNNINQVKPLSEKWESPVEIN